MSEMKYTTEKNVQIVISLLKTYGIKKIIASPGTTNMTFVASVQNDPWFEIYSSVDERSAAYLACGLAFESGEPVVISCTGATASRNYMPGLTEAFYRKLPILAITSHRGSDAIGHLFDQQIDRRERPSDIAVVSVTVPLVKDRRDAAYCRMETIKAILSLTQHGGGPAHINMYTDYSQDFSVKELPSIKPIIHYSAFDTLPSIPNGKRIAVVVGSHRRFMPEETLAIDNFCSAHNAAVFCDHTSGYHGKYEVHFALVFGQENYRSPLCDIDILIHIGEVSGDVIRLTAGEVWRVSEDGALRDTFGTLSSVFEMPEKFFFAAFTPDEFAPQNSYFLACMQEYTQVLSKIPELPFENVWMASIIHDKLPNGCTFHMGIYNSLRSYNFFELPSTVETSCNVGGFGIDGGLSTLIGSSFANPLRLHIGVFGDLAFFYDMNVLGNRHVGNNVRIMLVNNGKGAEFRNYGHLCSCLGESADPYVAAAGHYGNQSPTLVKHYAENLGYEYISASSKAEFLKVCDKFVSPELGNKPLVFEVFTDAENESESLRILRNLVTDNADFLRNKLSRVIRGTLGVNGIAVARRLLKR